MGLRMGFWVKVCWIQEKGNWAFEFLQTCLCLYGAND